MIMGGTSSSSSYEEFPDYIGVESCVDMRTDDEEVYLAKKEEEEEEEIDSRLSWSRRRRRGGADDRGRKKEYPPLIPLLAQTENLHSHMPWVLTRHYTPDGRLVLTEEKVRHHEYFRAHRHNGRLTLQLVTLDDEMLSYGHPGCQRKNEYEDVFESQASLCTSPSAEDGNDVKVEMDSQEEEEEEEVVVEEGEGEELMKAEKGISCGGGIKCLSYNSMAVGVVVGSPVSPSAAGSCMLGMMPLPALRQVHS